MLLLPRMCVLAPNSQTSYYMCYVVSPNLAKVECLKASGLSLHSDELQTKEALRSLHVLCLLCPKRPEIMVP